MAIISHIEHGLFEEFYPKSPYEMRFSAQREHEISNHFKWAWA